MPALDRKVYLTASQVAALKPAGEGETTGQQPTPSPAPTGLTPLLTDAPVELLAAAQAPGQQAQASVSQTTTTQAAQLPQTGTAPNYWALAGLTLLSLLGIKAPVRRQ